jgi:hypothetical protein
LLQKELEHIKISYSEAVKSEETIKRVHFAPDSKLPAADTINEYSFRNNSKNNESIVTIVNPFLVLFKFNLIFIFQKRIILIRKITMES